MKILIGSDLYWPSINGIATFARNLARGLADRGHEVAVVAPSPSGEKFVETDGNYRIFRLSSTPFAFYQNQRISVSVRAEMTHIVATFRPDIVHLQTSLGVGLAGVRVAKKFHVPIVGTNHVMPRNLLDNMKLLAPFARQIDTLLLEYGNRFYQKADYVTVPTLTAITMLKRKSLHKPVMAISNGIDLSKFYNNEQVPSEIIQRYGINRARPLIIYLGRLDAEKHVTVLLKALQILALKLPFQALIIGEGNDQRQLTEMVGGLKICDWVKVTGRVSENDKLQLLRLGTVFAMPSPAELQSIATLEALASGLPIVAVNAGALPELCIHARNGFLFDLDNDEQMAEAIGRLLVDEKLAKRMGAESLKIVREHDLKQTITKFERLYQTVIHDYALRFKNSEKKAVEIA